MQAKEIISNLNERANQLIVDYQDAYEYGTLVNIQQAIKALNAMRIELSTLMQFIYAIMGDNAEFKIYYVDVIRIYNKVKKVVAKYDD